MNNLLLINTPQYDYIEEGADTGSKTVQHDILEHLLYDSEFMKNVYLAGIVIDFFPITSEHFTDESEMKCLSFTLGASIDEEISHNLHFLQECVIKKLPKNDNVSYERSVLNNRDSGKFILDLLNAQVEGAEPIDDIYLCGFSKDNSIYTTLQMLSASYTNNKIHVIEDLIWSDNPSEKHNIDVFCQERGIQTHKFTNIK